MDDLIKRQDAIAAFEVTDWYHQNRNKDMVSGANSDEHQAWYKAEDVYMALESVSSAQPERNGWVHIDDIYRLISGHSNYHGDNILAALTCLAEGKEVFKPITVLDTQPNIIKCKDCKYSEIADTEDSQDGYTCQFHRGSIWFSGSYCSWAERRTDV